MKKLFAIHHKPSTSLGFTLLELLVVIAIIGILSAVGLGSYQKSRKKGSDAKVKADLKEIQNAMEQYYAIEGGYPIDQDSVASYFSENEWPKDPRATPYPEPTAGWDADDYQICHDMEIEGSGNNDCGGEDGACFCIWDLQGG